MKLPRRKFLHLAAGAAALPAVSRIARAESYPSRPVRIVVGFPPGGPSDIVARLIGQWLSERLGQPFIIENRPGASTNIATEVAVHASADGYTLLLVLPSAAINATLYDNLHFNFMHDIAPIASIMRAPYVLVINPSVPAKTLPEFISYAKANPGKITMASSGIGTGSHVTGELFKIMTADVTMLHVPYRGGAPAITDLLGGQVQAMFESIPSLIGHLQVGRLRALAVTTAVRADVLPDIPPIGDFLPGFEASFWAGLGVAAGTPAEIINKLNGQINAGFADPKMTDRLRDLGGTPLAGSPSDFGKLIANETEKWGKVIRTANIKPE
jgi:tripartite-type tricarboxylate transporter receptor subunit TctC